MKRGANNRIRNTDNSGLFARKVAVKVGGEAVDGFYLNSRSNKPKSRKVSRKTRKQFESAPDWKQTLRHGLLFGAFTLMVFTPIKWEVVPAVEEFFAGETITIYASEKPKTITPTPTISEGQGSEDMGSVPEPAVLGEYEEMRELIKEVFGDHADKAFKLLECENRGLDPKAVNTAGNYPEGSRDIGLFQINEYWQGVNAKFLFDAELNTRIAYKIFKDSDYTFKMWTCGKQMEGGEK